MRDNHQPILLIEDDDVDAEAVERSLQDLHVTNPLARASHGKEALVWLRDPSNRPPLLILLDLNLPVMSGLEFLQVVKADEHLKSIPVVVLTTSSLQRDKLASFQLSVAGYMVKPPTTVRFTEVLQTINSYWTTSETP